MSRGILCATILLLFMVAGCTSQDTTTQTTAPAPEITALPSGIELSVEVSDRTYSEGDTVTAHIKVRTNRKIRLQYLLFANDADGNTIYSYPFPPKEVLPLVGAEFDTEVRLDEYIPAGDYYFTALAFDENDELLSAFDEPVDVVVREQVMYAEVDCFDEKDDVDSNLCVYDLGTTGYVRIGLSKLNGDPITAPASVSGHFLKGDNEMAIEFEGLVGKLEVPAERGGYTGEITVSAEGHKTATKEFEFHCLNTSAIRVNCDLNGECGPFESYETCPEDCESGRQDWFCDMLKDGRCDPDCLPDEDPDCG